MFDPKRGRYSTDLSVFFWIHLMADENVVSGQHGGWLIVGMVGLEVA